MKKLSVAAILLVVGLTWLFSNVVAEEEANEYVGNSEKSCKMCHKDQVKEWKTWPMAKAWDRLSDEEKKDETCIACHTTGFGKPGGFISEKKTPKLLGVQCEACHGPAGKHMKVPMTDKEGKAATMGKPTEDNCIQCHNKKSPNFDGFKFKDGVKELAGHLKKEK